MVKRIALCSLLLLAAGGVFSQSSQSSQAQFSRHYRVGISRYQAGRWMEAASELRYAQESALNVEQWSEALYWIIMTELSLADYGSAVRDMDDLERYASDSVRAKDMLYHRARAYYYLGYYEEAIAFFRDYGSKAGDQTKARKAAAEYWIGECFYAQEQMNEARECFTRVVEQYHSSPKFAAAAYRLEQIQQKNAEADSMEAASTEADSKETNVDVTEKGANSTQ